MSDIDLKEVAAQPEIKPVAPLPATVRILLNPRTAPTDASGAALTPRQLAKRLASDLRKVQSAGSKKKDPLGWVVVVNLDVSGLKDVPLLLTWSVDGVDVPDTWVAENVAYRLTATTDHDSGSVNVWVPRFRKKGIYNVNVQLDRADDGTVLTQGDPLRLP